VNRFNTSLCTLSLFAWLSVACGAGQPRTEPMSGNESPADRAPAEQAAPSVEAAPEPEQPAVPEDAPLQLRARAEVDSGQVALVLEVLRGRARLASTLGVEREVDGHFVAVTGIAGLTLRSDCQTPAPECVALVAGAELRPPPWLGTLGDAQCICTRCGPAQAGTYRFVVSSCDGRQRAETERFTLPER